MCCRKKEAHPRDRKQPDPPSPPSRSLNQPTKVKFASPTHSESTKQHYQSQPLALDCRWSHSDLRFSVMRDYVPVPPSWYVLLRTSVLKPPFFRCTVPIQSY